MNLICAADRCRSGFGHSEIFYFSLFHKVGHRADRFLDRNLGINAVLIVKIDIIGSEPQQAGIAGGTDIIGTAVDAEKTAVLTAHVSEFRGKNNIASVCAQRLSDKLFILSDTVHVGGIEKFKPNSIAR